jgi:hypothetical protein
MTLVGWLFLVGVLGAAVANHVRLSKALARVDSVYSVLYGFKYRIREVEAEVKNSVDALRFEINPAAAPQEEHGGCGCGSHGADSHEHGAQTPAHGGAQLLQIQ